MPGRTALMLACQTISKKHLECIKHLLLTGADVEKDLKIIESGFSPLHIAASVGNIDAITLLIFHKANVNTLSKDGSTVLMAASYKGCEACVRMLVKAGAALETKSLVRNVFHASRKAFFNLLCAYCHSDYSISFWRPQNGQPCTKQLRVVVKQ